MATAYIGQFIGGSIIDIVSDLWTNVSSVAGNSTQVEITSEAPFGTLVARLTGSGFTFNAEGQVTAGTVELLQVDILSSSLSGTLFGLASEDPGGLNLDYAALAAALEGAADGVSALFTSMLNSYDLYFDAFEAGDGGVEFYAGSGDDYLVGSAGPDSLFGGDGFNIFDGFEGSDILVGGSFVDMAQYFQSVRADDIFSDGDNWFVKEASGDIDQLTGVEAVVSIDTISPNGGSEAYLLVGAGGFSTVSNALATFLGPYTVIVQGTDGNDTYSGLNNTEGIAFVIRGGDGDDFASQMSSGFLDFHGGNGDDRVEMKIGDKADGGKDDDFLKLNTFSTPANLEITTDPTGELQFRAEGTLLEIKDFEGFEIFANNSSKDFLLDLRGYEQGFLSSTFSTPRTNFSFFSTGNTSFYADAATVAVAELRGIKNIHLDFSGSSEGARIDSFDIVHGTKLNLNAMGTIFFESVEATGGSGNDFFFLDISSKPRSVLKGNAGEDKLYTSEAGGTINGGADNDILVGNIGVDIAVFSGSFRQYTIDLSNGLISGADGTDSFSNIELFKFDDGTFNLATGQFNGSDDDLDGGGGSDVLFRVGGGGNKFVATTGDGNSPIATIGETAADTVVAIGGNIDGIGGDDVIFTRVSNDSHYRVDAATGVTTNIGLNWIDLLGVTDVDGDGDFEFVAYSSGNGFSTWDASTGIKEVSIGRDGFTMLAVGNLVEQAGPADDGHQEFLMINNVTGSMNIFSDAGNFVAGVRNTSNFEFFGLADVNGDGVEESVFRNLTNLSYSAVDNNAAIVRNYARPDKDLAAIADLDGDGIDDLVFLQTNGRYQFVSGDQSWVKVLQMDDLDLVGVGNYDDSQDGAEDLLFRELDGSYIAVNGDRNVVVDYGHAGDTVLENDLFNTQIDNNSADDALLS